MATTPQTSRYYTYIQPILRNKAVKSYTPYVFNLVLCGLLVYFAIRPTLTAIANLQKNIDVNQQVLDTLTQKAKDLSLGQKNYEALSPETRAKILTAVPLTANVTTLLRSLETAAPPQASTSAIQVEPVPLFDSTQALSGHPTLQEVHFTYNVVGTYPQIMTTLSNLGKLPRLVSLTNVTISHQSDGPSILSVTGKAFYLK